jgi:hypothetical protein
MIRELPLPRAASGSAAREKSPIEDLKCLTMRARPAGAADAGGAIEKGR